MKKYFFIFGGVFFALLILFVSYLTITASNSVNIVDNYLEFQKSVDSEIDSYGYTIDNPLVIVDPYDVNTLSAMIVFQTDDYVSPTVIVKGQNNDDIIYTYSKSKIHHLPIYCLYSDYDNDVIIKVGNTSKVINIKTDTVDIDNTKLLNLDNDNMVITNVDNHLVIVDRYKNIRGYFTKEFSGNPIYLKDGHFILSTYQTNNDGSYMGIVEVDLLGKVYNQFIVSNGYYRLSTYNECKNMLYVLSDELLVIDVQSWSIIKEYDIDNLNYKYLEYNKELDKIILGTDNEVISMDIDGNRDIMDSYEFSNKYLIFDKNITKYDYLLFNYKLYGLLDKSKETKSISLLSYKKPDKYYNDFGLKFYFESNRLVVSSSKNIDNGYIILDKIFDKHSYEISGDYTVINGTSLSGKYSIYVKIGNKVYKTNYYVIF